MLLQIRGTSVLFKSKTALTTELLLMCRSRTGTGLVLSRGRGFRLGNSMLISSFTMWERIRLFVQLGNTLVFSYLDHAHQKNIRVYRTDACFSCEFFMTKCTLNKHGRTLWRWEHAEVLDEMRERLLREPEKLALRKRIVEHPFGTMKRAFNQGYLLLRGLRKVSGEVGFTMLAYNMRRVLNILGPGVCGFSGEVGKNGSGKIEKQDFSKLEASKRKVNNEFSHGLCS